MFLGGRFLAPGQELKTFTVLRPEVRETDRGRAANNGYAEVGRIEAVLALARPEEIHRWNQLEHPISHKIIMQNRPAFDITPGDIFEMGGRRFYHRVMPHDPLDIGHLTIFYCDERTDVT